MKKSAAPRSKYQKVMAKGGSAGKMHGGSGRSAYQKLTSSPKGRNAH